MKVAFAEDNVRGAQGIKETASFKINTTAHAFKILSSGLYSDKIRAVLREIGCNAQDAHIAAGCRERPIRVKVPNALDNQFYIQDWGPGLSHEDVMGLYSTYFGSTKQTSNEFTGAFGLGSKSPFSYTDSFSVVSVHGGKKRTYTIYLSNKGEPTTSLMSEEEPDADWPQGMRVGFAVKVADYNQFAAKAQEVFRWFETLPEIRGAEPVRAVKYRTRQDKFRVLADDDQSYVLMGSVAYPLDLAQIGVVDDDAILEGDEKQASQLLNWTRNVRGLVLPVGIGDVQVAASREVLQYDPESVKFLKARAKEVMTFIGEGIIDAIEQAERGGWAEMCKVGEKVEELLRGSMRWHFTGLGVALGLKKDRAEEIDKYLRRQDIDVPGAKVAHSGLKLVAMTRNSKVRIWTVHGSTLHDGSKAKLKVQPSTAIAYGNASHGALRAKRAIAEGHYTQVLVVTKTKERAATEAQAKRDAIALSAALGDMPMVDLATLTPPDIVKGGAKKAKKAKGWVPTLDANYSARYVDIHGDKSSKRLGDIKPEVMVCLAPRSGWGRGGSDMRVYDTTLDADYSMEYRQWEALWDQYSCIAKSLKLPGTAEGYAQVSAAEIKGLYLKQLGWKNAYEFVREYLMRKDVRDALRAKLKSWRPTLPPYVYGTHGWITALAGKAFDELSEGTQPLLEILKMKPDVRSLVADIATETKRSKRRGTLPPEVEAYEFLSQKFPRDVTDRLEAKDCLSLDDMDKAFTTRFPRAHCMPGNEFIGFYSKSRGDAAELLEFILAKEV